MNRGRIRRVMSNSFGFGGINCSLILARQSPDDGGCLRCVRLGTWPARLGGGKISVYRRRDYVPTDCSPAARPVVANERRRAGLATRLALFLAQQASDMAGVAPGSIPSVFATSNGDGAVVHTILEAFAAASTRITHAVPQFGAQRGSGLLVDRNGIAAAYDLHSRPCRTAGYGTAEGGGRGAGRKSTPVALRVRRAAATATRGKRPTTGLWASACVCPDMPEPAWPGSPMRL